MNTRRTLLLITTLAAMVLLAACTTTDKQAKTETRPPDTTADTLEASTPPIEKSVLDNGLNVIVIENHTVPLTTIHIAVRTGAFTETPEINGVMHLYEHMFFKGNAAIPSQEAYMKRVRELGISFNGTTGAEAVNYFFTLPTANLKAGLQFMYDALTSTLFDEEELAKEKVVVLSEFDRNESEPGHWFHKALQEAVFFKYPERKSPLGSRDAVKAATPETMRAIKNRYYIPNNSALIIAGDTTPAEATALVKEVFSGWKKGDDPFVSAPIPKHPPLTHTKQLAVFQPVRVATLMYEWQGPSVGEDPKATYAADVFSYILGLRSSGFYQRMVDSGLTYGASMSYYTQNQTGPISLHAQTEPKNIKATIESFELELKNMLNPDYFSDEELIRAKRRVVINELYARESARSFAQSLAFWWCTSGIDYYLSYVENIMAVSREDINAYLKAYVIGKPRVEAVMMSKDDGLVHLAGTPFAVIEPGDEKEVQQ